MTKTAEIPIAKKGYCETLQRMKLRRCRRAQSVETGSKEESVMGLAGDKKERQLVSSRWPEEREGKRYKFFLLQKESTI